MADPDDDLGAMLRRLRAGDRLEIAPGIYQGGLYAENLRGSGKEEPIIVTAADPERPPIIKGGSNTGIHLSNCQNLKLEHLVVDGFAINGINVDDGGDGTPATGITLSGVEVRNIGPRGNHDGLKLSGVDDFRIDDCHIEGWGGSAIDMVGCHNGVITGSRFVGKSGFSRSSAIQTKGGSADILIAGNWFLNAGQRAVNLGGSTGKPYFRPLGADHEARDITVANNFFLGGDCAVAFATSQGGVVVNNTILMPQRWVFRILQEQPTSEIRACADGAVRDNVIVHDNSVRTAVNVGGNTKPETFTFAGNAWFNTSGGSRPSLPVEESGGIHGVDPGIAVNQKNFLGQNLEPSNTRLKAKGAQPPEAE